MATSPKRSSSSPKWIRPIEVFSLRRRAKQSTGNKVLQTIDRNILASHLNPPLPAQTNSNSFNPFRKFPQKRKIDDVQDENRACLDNSTYLNQSTKCLDSRPSFGFRVRVVHNDQRFLTPAVFDETANSASDVQEISKSEPERFSHLPLDWSLKTRVRFMSSKPFPFRGSLKTSEEASGMTSFTRCIHSTKVQECSVDTSANAKFHQHCLVWQLPSLPWLKLFPRHRESRGGGAGQTSIFANNSPMQDSLRAEWCEGLRSLFHLVRARQCPFFYLCASTFTVLFRAGGVAGIPDTHALLTPTTTGIRRLLRLQGIEFSMPLRLKTESEDLDASCGVDAQLFPAAETNISGTSGAPVEKDDEDDQEPEEFLESLGLSQQDFPSLNTKRRKIDRDVKEGGIDMCPESLVYVEGPEAQSLLSFFLSSQGGSLCVPSTGPLAGVPATLLAPCAFYGATLSAVKARQGWMKQGNKSKHCVDLSGPILPNMIHGMVTLFSSTQDGNFSSVLASDSRTTSFNHVSPDKGTFMPSAFATENLKDCGLSSDFLLQLCNSTHRTVFNELDVKDKLYSWS